MKLPRIQSALVRLLIIVGLGVLVVAGAASAQGGDFTKEMGEQLGAAGGAAGYSAPVDPRVTAINVVRIILTLVGTIVFIIAVYAGFTWMTAGGDEEKISKATALLRNCVIGLAIIMLAYAITIAIANIAQGYPINTGSNQYQKILIK